MATSGSLTTDDYDGRYYKLSWERTSYSVANNTSTIKWTLSCAGGSGWYAERTLKVVIAGKTVKDKTSRVERYAGTIDSGTMTINHNTDGTKSFSASIKAAVYTSSVNCTGSKSFTLTAIPRASTIAATNAKIGAESTLTITRKVSSYTHTIKYDFGGTTGTIISKTDSTSYKWTIPTSLAKIITTGESVNGAIICDTYNGDTLIGTNTCPITISLSSEYYPKASIDAWATDDLSIRLMGSNLGVILGVSDIGYEVKASTGDGATISSFSVVNGTAKKTTATGVFTDATSDNTEATVKDSRGLSVFTNIQFGTVIKYVALTNSFSAKMTAEGIISFNTSGTYFKGSFGAVENTLKVQYRYKTTEEDSYCAWVDIDTSSAKATGSYNLSGTVTDLDYTKTYQFQTRAIDEISTTIATVKKLNAFPIFDWGEEDFNVNVELRIKDVNIFELIYPVGSIYMSLSETNPSTLFGGTWERIQDRFLLAAGSTYAAGDTGGEAEHTLTTEEIPSHHHTVWGRSVYSGTGSYIGLCNKDNSSTSYVTGNTGGGKAHNNMPPYLAVYMWQRTA